MRVLILSPYPEQLKAVCAKTGDEVANTMDKPVDIVFGDYDRVISFGYRHIIPVRILCMLSRPIINIHLSYLPWNRGADPNFWSWLDDTPKGVTIHEIDAGIDTGPIVKQLQWTPWLNLEQETLASSYVFLRSLAEILFAQTWPRIRLGNYPTAPQLGKGSYHRFKDEEPYWDKLPLKYGTPVAEVMALKKDPERQAAGS